MDAWRDRYDSWKTTDTRYADAPWKHSVYCPAQDGEECNCQDELDAQAEDAAIERAERRREDMMFDRDSWED